MRITDIQVEGFGVWSGLTVEEIGPGMTVFYGPNEAGKTTLLQFVRAVLYGFAEERRDKYLPPVHGGQAGGSIYFAASNGEYQVQRIDFNGNKTDPRGELVVTAADGKVSGAEGFSRLLGDVDESVFSNVFAIGLREIQELATLNDTEAAHELYKLASGLDRVSLIDVMRNLRQDRERIIGTSESQGRLRHLTAELKEVERKLEQARGASKRWAKLGLELVDLENDLEELKTKIDQSEREARQVEMAIQIAPRWRERESLEGRIESLGDLPDESLVSLDKLDRVNHKLGQLVGQIEEVSEKLSSTKQEGRSLPINNELLGHSCRIEAISEHMPWMQSLEKQIERLREESSDLHEEMGLGSESPNEEELADTAALDLDITARTMSILKGPARSLRKSKQRLEAAERDRTAADLQMASTREELEALMLECGCEELDPAIEEAGRRVNEVKRRKQVEDRLRRLDQQRRQMDDEIELANEAQAMPIGRTMLVGLFVIVGLGLAMFGFAGRFLESVPANPGMGIFGILLAVVGWTIKLVGDSRARNHLERTQRQQDLLHGQIQRAKRERDELRSQNGSDDRSFEELMTEADHDLQRLEELIPYREELANCQTACDEAQLQFENAEQGVETAQRRWEGSLRGVNLPTSLNPSRVKAIYEQVERVGQSKHRWNECRQELIEREEELARLQERVSGIASDAGISVDGHGENELIQILSERLAEQRQLKRARSELKSQYKSLRQKQRSLKRQRDRMESFKERMLAKIGVHDDAGFRDCALKLNQRTELLGQLGEIDRHIDTAIGRQFDRDTILAIVIEWGEKGLEQHWEQMLAEIENLEKKSGELNVQRGERQHEMKSLGEQKESDRLEFRAETLRAQKRKEIQKWRSVAMTHSVLDSVRRRYEEERQPETLNEASKYLAEITNQKYVRIWTRLEGDSLFVDQNEGGTLRVDVLSQGTREAIFLSLRLALASAYARRGIEFPLVLDDLLVNYDGERTQAAAQVLLEYATKRKQLVFFTCHDHVRDLFCDLGADVRILPSQIDVVESEATAERYVPLEDEIEETEEEYEEEIEEEWEEEEVLDSDEVVDEEDVEEEEEELEDEEVVLEEEEVEEPEPEDEVEATVEELLETAQTTHVIPEAVSDRDEEELEASRERVTWSASDMWWD